MKKVALFVYAAFVVHSLDCFSMNDYVYPGPEELNNRLYNCGLEEFAVRTRVAKSIAYRIIDNEITDYYLLEAMRAYYKDDDTKVLCNGYVINRERFQDNKNYIKDCLSGRRQ